MASKATLFGPDAPRVWSIPAGEDFLRALAKALAAETGLAKKPDVLAEAIIYVPNKRSARVLLRALFEAADENPILPPDIRALGDLESDEAPPTAESGLANLPPALSPALRIGTLANLVQKFYETNYDLQLPPASALSAARELARILDQAHLTPEVDWSGLPDLVKNADMATHWESSAKFLEIISTAWPAWLAEQGAMDPLARRLAAAKATAAMWEITPPKGPVLIAGSTGATPAGRVLMKAAVNLKQGLVVLPGLDTEIMPDTRETIRAEVSHPQNVLLETLDVLGLAPDQVALWPGIIESAPRQARRRMIHEALAPADATADWRETLDEMARRSETDVVSFATSALEGVSLIEAPDEAAEAAAAALMMREVLETEHDTAALITPDAGLARRVSALLRRWDIDVPPSAGLPVGRTLAGSFIGLCAKWAVDPSDPVLMLSVLKHGMASPIPGLAYLELYFLRGPRRWQSLEELVESIATRHLIEPYPAFKADDQAAAQVIVRWLIDIFQQVNADLSTVDLVGGRDGAERIAALAGAISETPLPWAGEDGAATSRLLEFVGELSASLGPMRPAALADLINTEAAQMTVSTGQSEHPRLSIWGPLEARLQSASRVILAGLNEDVWPKRPAPDAFLPRRFRTELGLGDPEDRMGLAAHDFAQLACAPNVTFLHAQRRNDAPAVASRWIWRLKTLAQGALDDAAIETLKPAGLDPMLLVDRVQEMGIGCLPSDFTAEPSPTARKAGWPERLSVTRVDLLQRDPYALWAEQVLGLTKLDALNDELGPAPRGTAIHRALELFEDEAEEKSSARLLELLEQELRRVGEPADAWAGREAVWKRTADWYLNWRATRDTAGAAAKLEVKGSLILDIEGSPFRLTAHADRIEQTANGDLVIVDFKTGAPPKDKEVATGLSQQMPLQALIAISGGYEGIQAARVDQLHYVAFKAKPEAFSLGGGKYLTADVGEMAELAESGLKKLIAEYRNPSAQFLSAPRVKFVKYDNGYNLLARRAEWAGDTEDGEGGDA